MGISNNCLVKQQYKKITGSSLTRRARIQLHAQTSLGAGQEMEQEIISFCIFYIEQIEGQWKRHILVFLIHFSL